MIRTCIGQQEVIPSSWFEADCIKCLRKAFPQYSYNKIRRQNSLAAAPIFSRQLQLTYNKKPYVATVCWLQPAVINFDLFRDLILNFSVYKIEFGQKSPSVTELVMKKYWCLAVMPKFIGCSSHIQLQPTSTTKTRHNYGMPQNFSCCLQLFDVLPYKFIMCV